jgi:mannose-6-phosphate isomerase
VKPEPFRIEPKFVERIWGMRSLAPLFPGKTNLPEPVGEVWLTGVDCKIATGPFAGKTLGEAWRQMPPEWRGTRFSEPSDFPILNKFIFSNDKLSIQVHPDDAYAAVHEKAAGGRGKTEMWHVLSAEPGAQVLAGLKSGSTKEKFVSAIKSNVLEELFVVWPVAAGDTMFLPARTPHTIGPGMVICEVQEYSDLTYRVYDYGRVDASGKPRELHIEKALEVMNFGTAEGGKKTNPISISTTLYEKSILAACPYFAAERLELGVLQSSTEASQFELLIVASGSGVLDGPGFGRPYRSGECWLMPANLGQFYMIAGAEFPARNGQYKQSQGGERTIIIRTYVPDLGVLRSQLMRNGVTKGQMSQFLFD